jgi:hypothetical protein
MKKLPASVWPKRRITSSRSAGSPGSGSTDLARLDELNLQLKTNPPS